MLFVDFITCVCHLSSIITRFLKERKLFWFTDAEVSSFGHLASVFLCQWWKRISWWTLKKCIEEKIDHLRATRRGRRDIFHVFITFPKPVMSWISQWFNLFNMSEVSCCYHFQNPTLKHCVVNCEQNVQYMRLFLFSDWEHYITVPGSKRLMSTL